MSRRLPLVPSRSAFNNISSDIYYLAFPNDPLQRKLLVYAVYVAEMVQAIILARMAYIQFAAGFGNFDTLDAIPVILWFGVPILSSVGMYHPVFWLLVVHLLTSILVTAVVQIFYAYRIKLLADSYRIPIVAVLVSFKFILMHLEWLVFHLRKLALLQLGGGITLGVLSARMPFFSRLLGKKTNIAAGVCTSEFSPFRL